jgi:hypothetical protein
MNTAAIAATRHNAGAKTLTAFSKHALEFGSAVLHSQAPARKTFLRQFSVVSLVRRYLQIWDNKMA